MAAGSDVVVVGAGRVGTALAARLLEGGRDVSLVTRSAASLVRASAAAPDVPVVGLEAVTTAAVVLLCVADDDLPAVVASLPAPASGALVAHTSGRYGVSVLDGLTGHKAAIHPVMTFAGGPTDLANLDGIAYGVTAQGTGLAAAAVLVADLGGLVELVPEELRPLYHAGLSHAANHLVTLVADAADLLHQAGIEDTSRMLGAITGAALANALATDPATGRPAADAALTGPVVRGDAGTVAAHLAALRGMPAEPAYRAMARRTAERAEEAGRLSHESALAILEQLPPPG
ncbi:MAG: hypothetical protein QOE76_3187 [Frankiales bacterium]|jgi:predicted short-subunit dehydrogenase-like oxidoreductase (DUF2520 family)|nr:hypothetical protein [Frankiales bacterium]